MPGLYTHSTGEVIRRLLINMALGADPPPPSPQGTTWPVYAPKEPDSPDNVITVQGTAGVVGPSNMIDGEFNTLEGFQVRVRGANNHLAARKANAIADGLQRITWKVITCPAVTKDGQTVPAGTYKVQQVSISSGPIELGNESPESKRYLFTINGLVSMSQVS